MFKKGKIGTLFFLVISLFFLIVGNVSAAPIFKDLGNAKWAENEILYLHDKNVVTGYPNGNFGVNDTIRRADAALMLARAKNLDLDKVSMNPSFPDVDKDAYYYQAVEAAAEAGYINGYPNGNFGPDDTLTREQMAKIIATAYEYTPIEEAGNYFSDINNTWAKSYINTIAANGISNGSPDGTFNPKKNITRAEFSVMLARAMNDAYKVQPPTIQKELQVHFIDVGQGDSILIKTENGKTMLIDGGKRSAGDKVVSYLRSQGVSTIDIMVATHPDADHIGGLIDVLEQLEVKKVLDSGKSHTTETYLEYLTLIDEKEIPFEVAKEGSFVEFDNQVQVQVLNGLNEGNDNNESSVVLKVTQGTIDFLLTGDASVANEADMVRKYNVEAEVLKVGHHGSDTSTSQAFVNAVRPKAAILSYGENNYGHPDSSVVSRLKNAGATLYSTYESGDIVVKTDGKTFDVSAKPWKGDGTVQPEPTPEPKPEPTPEPGVQFPININTADYETLQLIPGIGEALARNIIEYRNANGPFKSIQELDNVKRIGPATIEKIRPYITLG